MDASGISAGLAAGAAFSVLWHDGERRAATLRRTATLGCVEAVDPATGESVYVSYAYVSEARPGGATTSRATS